MELEKKNGCHDGAASSAPIFHFPTLSLPARRRGKEKQGRGWSLVDGVECLARLFDFIRKTNWFVCVHFRPGNTIFYRTRTVPVNRLENWTRSWNKFPTFTRRGFPPMNVSNRKKLYGSRIGRATTLCLSLVLKNFISSDGNVCHKKGKGGKIEISRYTGCS